MPLKPPLPHDQASSLGSALVAVMKPALRHKWLVWDMQVIKGENVPVAVIAMPSLGAANELLNVLENAMKVADEFDDRLEPAS